ncbi:chromosome segregation protein SMC [Metabacillus sediminilitoris]|uniref:Chromosome partition protein Smc n=1 Tax=Metabacillus sediminilitoris TaxID=2567941 RepID=A0A4S4C725_9BACI|nr:chromosome segregation protein SMC [Metabacillus sediminilitoris]QGQ46887.1 chromosome segregation protein SMC [Metabacillus sediminilitoris]THF83035.1 chromosome segregation protein SMC [Metabacillus sediminilitoris]
MFLKRLDIVGFKSFAERVTVDFVKGVTAVVGPNGSGKSNITDGIRWVLGEQSAKSLRGAKMEDIIFAGSDSRKALNIAEVTLTLDNEDHFLPIDYHEVSVTRRVYRSGDSEFFINNQSCRLKDIVDLFMDSGLGKEAFSIISQGKVEEILSSKSEERRTIFEEAAGVLKYKSRKKKAEYKLAETQENLNRVQDILHELENQVEPLRIQASIAKDYLEQKEALEKIEVALTVYEIEELHGKYESLAKTVEEGKDRELQLSATMQKKEAEVASMRDHLTALDESIDDLQQVLLLASEELEKLEGRREVLKERKKNAHQNKSQLEKTIEELTSHISLLKLEKNEQELSLETYKKELKTIKDQLSNKQQLMNSYNQNIEEVIEDLKSDYFECLNKQASARNEIQYLDDQFNQHEHKSLKLLDSNKRYITERQEILEMKAKIEAKYSLVESQLSEQIKNFRDAQTKLENLKNTYQKKETTLYQAYQILQQTRSRKEVLESMQEDYAGFFQGVKEILKAKDQLGGIHGAVAELISTEKNYETAIEIALSSTMQHVVVEDESSARKAIKYLKQHSFGRATFLPLSVIKERSINSHDLRTIQTHQAFVGIATDLVKYQPQFKSIIGNLLGTVIITSDLKGANEIAKLMNYRYRLVTLQGDVVNPGGSMTGGAMKQKNNSLLSRQRELETINGKLAEMEEKTAQFEKDVKATKETIQNQEMLLEELRSSGEKLRLEEQMIRSEIREIELNEKNVNDHLTLYDAERESFQSEKDKIAARKHELNQNLQTLSKKLDELDKEIEELSEKKISQQTSKDELQNELTELKVILASKNQIYENQKEKVERINRDLEQSQQKFEEANEDYSLLSSEMTSNSSGEEKLEEAAKNKLNDKTKTIELISNRRNERLKLQEKLEFEERELKELKRQDKQLQDILKDEEVKLNRLDVELDNRLNHLREEYFLTFEGAKEKYKLEIDLDEARKRVKLTKLAIDELGTVNLGAIDEYERVSERYTFLSEQRTDLTEAKDTLYQVMDEMDEEMKVRFEQTFNAIRSHFETVFQAMFGGGRAELKLTNPNDLLNTGVDIVAQPPGKKLQNLGLLSGGERALTAIALLFSILKVRPVPFCVLDEVEAALDEANVYRFAQYLKKFSHETQFIVITHRKGTMEEADVLYGVTMQESGVSKLVSVRLEETNELVKSS